MRKIGLGGAYLCFVQGTQDPPHVVPPAEQLSDPWWDRVRFAVREAKRLDLKLALHVCDGFATMGGPWITPELSMQKIVWSDTVVEGAMHFNGTLPQASANECYYRDLAVFAYPVNKEDLKNTYNTIPKVSCSVPGQNPQLLAEKLLELAFKGATILFEQRPPGTLFLEESGLDNELIKVFKKVWEITPYSVSDGYDTISMRSYGKGRVLEGPYRAASFKLVDFDPDLMVHKGRDISNTIAWTHRLVDNTHIYFISNQLEKRQNINISLRESGLLGPVEIIESDN